MSCNFSPLLQSTAANVFQNANFGQITQSSLQTQPTKIETAEPKIVGTFESNKNNSSKLPKRLAIGGGIGAATGFFGTFGIKKGVGSFYKSCANGANSKAWANLATRALQIFTSSEDELGDVLGQIVKTKIENPAEFIDTISTSEEEASKLLKSMGEVVSKNTLKTSVKGALVIGAIGLMIGAAMHFVKEKNSKEG